MHFIIPLFALVLGFVQADDLAPLASCPEGYGFVGGMCYMVRMESTNYEEARAFCMKTGGSLASPNSKSDIDVLHGLAKQATASDDSYRLFFLSYTDKEEEGVFVDDKGQVMTYSTFAAGEPNNCCGGENCIGFYSTTGGMNDVPCDTTLGGFFCSAQEVFRGDPDSRCPPQWHEHWGNCYRFFDGPKTFDDAEANCQSYQNGHGQSAHLTSVTCGEENIFLVELIRLSLPGAEEDIRTWIGFEDKNQENHFRWVDQSAEDYTNWKSGEPNDSGGEDCTETNCVVPGQWNDIPCSLERPSICKMPVYDPACHKLADTIKELTEQCNAAHSFQK